MNQRDATAQPSSLWDARDLAATARAGLSNSEAGVAAIEAIDTMEKRLRGLCPWCSAKPRQRHDEWCPCSTESRRFIRAQYRISDAAGQAAADRIYAAAETISGAGRA